MSENTVTDDIQTDLVYTLACAKPGGLCFAARASGLYVSQDGGLNWRFAYESLGVEDALPTTSVVISPDFAEDHSVFAGVPGAVLHSTDGGETWFIASLTSPPPAVSSLVISPNFIEDGVLVAGTIEDGVFRSADRGSRWVAWNFGLLDLHILCLAISPNFSNDETLFAGVDSGIFRSTNGGRAWREVDLPVGFEPVLSLAISPNYTHDGVIFAGTETQGVLCSADGGESWTRLGVDVFSGPVNGIVLSPTFESTPDVLVLLDDTLLISRDGGRSWQNVSEVPGGASTVLAPEGLSSGSTLLVGLVGGKVIRVPLS